MKLKYHPIANIFQLLEGEAFDALVEDIRANGLLEPIWLYEGKILDGRNRYRACLAAKREPTFRDYEGDNPLSFAVSLNLHRRHLSESQRAMVAARIKPMFEEAARERQGMRTDIPANLPECQFGEAREQAATLLNVSARSVQAATKVLEKATPELVAAVDADLIAVSRAESLAEMPAEKQVKVVNKITSGEAKNPQDALRQIRLESTDEPVLPEGKYRVLYADPPWFYSANHLDDYGPAERHYPTMKIEELCDLPVKDLADDDAVLFLWATSPLLEQAFKVVNAWGFSYKASFVWYKVKHNYGHYNSVRHELLLLCTRGSCPPDVSTLINSVVTLERSDKHSEKPEEFRQIIDQLYPKGPRVELFARDPVAGWVTWGNELCQETAITQTV